MTSRAMFVGQTADIWTDKVALVSIELDSHILPMSDTLLWLWLESACLKLTCFTSCGEFLAIHVR